ncbi:MAG: hypothetical protein JSU76_04015 [Dehalococcoidia bacterium]|nr:MAG: hypothetical protein JSU76_04015 [Dehalococcoidia bacterium]
MEQRIQINIFYIVGIVSAIAGVAYLAAEYVEYLSEPGKLGCLILLAGVFGSLGKYFEDRGR